jgi:hypothetical protein
MQAGDERRDSQENRSATVRRGIVWEVVARTTWLRIRAIASITIGYRNARFK